MAVNQTTSYQGVDEKEYKRRIRAWTMYDWANSAFATTILAAVLPIYYSQVAGANLPSATVATAYWSTGLSVALFIVAIISPILGTISDVMRGKKRFLAIFFGLGIVTTGLLVLVDTGDWLLASILFIVGRIGFTGANVFYDALLPHISKEEDRDRVSTRGYAMGYLGGGILLAINIVMIELLPGTWGPRISFLSVAVWWLVFSIPLFRNIPEPPAATASLEPGQTVVSVSVNRLWNTLKDIKQYKELFKYLLAFLVYVDGIGTIIGVAAIYGAELGFGSMEMILALLLVQFVGIPFSLLFGRLPSGKDKRSPIFLAFVVFNLIALPLTGVMGARLLPGEVSGAQPAPFTDTATTLGEGIYPASYSRIEYSGKWETLEVSAEVLGTDVGKEYLISTDPDSHYEFPFNGQGIEIEYSLGPDHGIWKVFLDGVPYLDEQDEPTTIDAYNSTVRYGVSESFLSDEPGEHTLSLMNTDDRNPQSQGVVMNLGEIHVLAPVRKSNLGAIIGIILGIELIGLLLAWILGPMVFGDLSKRMDTKRSILLALMVYTIIAVWGYFLNSVIEFWLLAWMVAVVQGGCQALSRSLFASMAPSSKSGEFFGLFGIMEKFSTIVGPLVFAFAATTFGSSRPAVLSLVAFFIVGGYLLTKVNVEDGKRVAQAEDRIWLKESARE